MTSRDERASYYDLELPDGTRTEVWSVLRAVLTPEEALGYAKACLLTRVMRDGKKLDVDRLREAEKVGIEAGMLREAMDAYLATPGSAAPNAVGVGGPTRAADEAAMMTATEAAQRFMDDAWKEQLTRIRPDGYLRWVPDNARIAELERERDEARAELGGITETLVASGLAQSHEEAYWMGTWAAWRHLHAALAAATEKAEALQRIVTDFAEATGWMVCEYPPADDVECERCGTQNRQLYYRRTSVDVDEGESWCAECVMSEPWDNMVSATQRADALAARLAEVEDRERPA